MRSLAQEVQHVTGETVKLAFVDQGYTGEGPAQAAQEEGIELHSRKTVGGQERPCIAAAPPGRGAQCQLGQSVPTPGP